MRYAGYAHEGRESTYFAGGGGGVYQGVLDLRI